MLIVSGIHTYYGLSHVLFDVSLEVPQGEAVGPRGEGDCAPGRAHVGVHDSQEDRPGRKGPESRGEGEGAGLDVLRRDVVADVHDRGLGVHGENGALHGADVVVLEPEVRQQGNDGSHPAEDCNVHFSRR
jgi:hypothetical protein